MPNVSDYKLAASAIKKLCRHNSIAFKDIPLHFNESGVGLNKGSLLLSSPKNIGHALYLIVSGYVEKSQDIVGKSFFKDKQSKDLFLMHQASVFRRIMYFSYEPVWPESKSEKPFSHRMYQRPLVWSVMKNIICPAFSKSIKNVKIVCAASNILDIAVYFKEGDAVGKNMPDGDFVYINDVPNDAVKNAIMLIECVRAHELEPYTVFNEIFETDLYTKLVGIVRLALVEEDAVDEFFAVLFDVLNLPKEIYPHLNIVVSDIKTAQAGASPSSQQQWWYSGLTEKMLEPTRGSDWSTRQELVGFLKEFWDDVEKIRCSKPQGEGVAFNDLLRLQQLHSTETIGADQTIQGLLGSQRVW